MTNTLNRCPKCGARERIDGHACPEGKEADRCTIGKKQVSTEPVNTNGLNANAYKAACEARTHYRQYTDVLAYTIADEDAAFINAYIAESSNGRKANFESVNAGSTPSSASSTLNQWTCFHCGETFNTTGAALTHFGDNPLSTPGCVAKVEVGHERGWLMHVRKLEKARDDLAVLRSAEFADQAKDWSPAMYVTRHSDYEKMEKIVDELVKDLPFPDTQSSEIPVDEGKIHLILADALNHQGYFNSEDIADVCMQALCPYLSLTKRESNWLPMQDAPKDERIILIGNRHGTWPAQRLHIGYPNEGYYEVGGCSTKINADGWIPIPKFNSIEGGAS